MDFRLSADGRTGSDRVLWHARAVESGVPHRVASLSAEWADLLRKLSRSADSAALAPAIRGFVSLNNFPRHTLHSAPRLVKREDAKWKSADPGADRTHPQLTAVSGNETLHAIAPYDLATLYNVQPLWDSGIDGTGQTIAIVSTSDINPADIDSFRSSFGLPAKKLNIIYVGPNPGMASMGAEGEADLDVEWAGAVAKEATIDLVVAGNTPTSGGVEGAAAYIVNNNLASIMNVSYGACEYELGAAAISSMRQYGSRPRLKASLSSLPQATQDRHPAM